MYSPEEDFAEGGIVAFNGTDGSAVRDPDAPAVRDNPFSRLDTDGEERGVGFEDLAFTSKGDPETYGKLAAIYPGAIESLGNFKETEIKPDTLRKVGADEIAAYREAMGPNTAEEAQLADIKARKGELSRNLEEGKGVALLKAAYAVTQGTNWARAFAGAGAAFGDEYNRALQADKIEKRSIATAQFNLADSKRKESLGLFKEGRAAEGRYIAAVKAADKARLDKAKAYADAIKGGMNATKPLRSAFSNAGAGGPKPLKVAEDAAAITKQIITLEAKDPSDPQIAILKKQRAGLIEILGTGKEGPTAAARATAQLTATQNRKVMDRLSAWEDSTEAKKAKKLGTYDELYQTMFDKYVEEAMAGVTPSKPAAASPAPTASTAPGNIIDYDANGKRITK